MSDPRTHDLGGQGRHAKGQKGWYREQPQTTEATQVLADKPDFPNGRIPVLKALLNNPNQEGDMIPLPPHFLQSAG